MPVTVGRDTRGGPAPALSPIRRAKSTAEEVEERLIMAIARGDKVAGERITEADLAQSLNVSRVPAREAMQKLEVRGILVGGEQRGLRVADYGPQRIAELLELRLAVETIILEHVMREGRDNTALLADLQQCVAGMAALSNSGDPVALGSIDLEFHRTLARHSGNELAAQIWDGLAQHMLIVFCRDWGDAFDRKGEVNLHEDLILFIKSGNAADIRSVLLRHFSPPSTRDDLALGEQHDQTR